MPRSQLKEQPEYTFRHDLTVRATDINYGGHLGTEGIVGLLHEARARLFQEIGLPSVKATHGAVGLAIGDLVLNMKREAFAFEEIRVESQIGEVAEKSLRLFQRISRNGDLLVLAETGLVAFDYDIRRPVPLPDAVRRWVDEHGIS
jgi:acyl-CoA thioesterase FadM